VREKVLIFGANFQLATRIMELIRRKYEVVGCDFAGRSELGSQQIATAFNGELLPRLATYHGVAFVIVTTEPLLYLHSPAALQGLIDEFKCLKRNHSVRLIIVEIDRLIIAESRSDTLQVRLTEADSLYRQRLEILRKALVGLADLTLQIQSFYSCTGDSWAPNFLLALLELNSANNIQVLADSSPWQVSSADAVAFALESNINRSGSVALSPAPIEGGLPGFCTTAVHYLSPWSSLSYVDTPRPEPVTNALQIGKDRQVHGDLDAFAHQSRCSVNYLYRKSPQDLFGDESVAKFRFKLGLALAQSLPSAVAETIDLVVPVPETGKIYAQGLAQGIGVAYVEAIYKTDRKRSFDIENFDVRKEFLFERLGVTPDLLIGKTSSLSMKPSLQVRP